MRFRKVLLFNPPVSAEHGAIRPSMSLGYIAQVLSANGIEYRVLDMMLGYSLKDLQQRIDTFKPDLIGATLFSYKYKVTFDLLTAIKRYHPSVATIIGGPFVSSMRKQVLEGCPAVDFGIVMEGEKAIVDLCRGEELKNIKGLIYRNGEEIVFNGNLELISNLDSIPFPTYEGFEIPKYIDEKSLISSRGCPYSCVYCSVGVTIGKKIRLRDPAHVVDEIHYWYRKGHRQFAFLDDNFTFYKDHVLGICTEIERRELRDLFLRCAAARADRVDREILQAMKNVGFRTIAFGVEAGNNRILKILKKGETMEEIEEAIGTACDLGYDVYLNFLIGSPYETLADIQDTKRVALKYPIFYAEFYNIIPYPGTELYDWLCHKGYLFKEPESFLNDDSQYSDTPIFETPELPAGERKKILASMKGLEREILRRAFSRRLQQRGIPWGLGHLIAYIASREPIRMQLFKNNKVRKIADKIRLYLYSARRNWRYKVTQQI